MFLEARQEAIARLIERKGHVTVSALAEKFDVTEDCIRKDLRRLVAEGRCRKVYGGATRIDPEVNRVVAERVDLLRPEKQAIAAKAFAMLKPRQTVYLDFSSSNILLAQLVGAGDLSLTVVSSSVDVLRAASSGTNVRTFCPGGSYDAEYNGFVGNLAASALDPYRFDAAFMGAVGIEAEAGDVLTLDMEDVPAKQAAMARAEVNVLLCDTDKLGHAGTYRYATLDDFDLAICDEVRPDAVERLRATGLTVA